MPSSLNRFVRVATALLAVPVTGSVQGIVPEVQLAPRGLGRLGGRSVGRRETASALDLREVMLVGIVQNIGRKFGLNPGEATVARPWVGRFGAVRGPRYSVRLPGPDCTAAGRLLRIIVSI